ncbi:flagellar protein FliT [Massilia cavernae]|uniref:Flagellar protein FliT n=1 Tax=Massilia cavernae TaxID=2320864 RepID=A0A418XST5_9BURK|nr:flagellar protein FliT [Massilia cavernae]RJG15591.1 flagellar protein FliT [Massilia cavernae]
MMTSQEVLSTYESMVELTEQMVAAASSSDWDRLVVLETRCAGHVEALRQNEAKVELNGDSRLRKVQCIKKLLDDDRKIRDLTMPWMTQLSALINNTGTQRRLAAAYGAV